MSSATPRLIRTPSFPIFPSRIRNPIRIQAIRRGLFDGRPVRDPLHGFLPGHQAIQGSRYATGGQHRQGTATAFAFSATHPDLVMIPVMYEAASSPVTDHRHLLASWTLAGQPIAILLLGVAFVAGTWDNNDHSRREGASWRVSRQGTLLQPAAFAPMY
jgi:hypothetical protein